MKISERIQGFYTPDRFSQRGTKILKPDQEEKEISQLSVNKKTNTEMKDISLKRVLSTKEVDSLTALFGYEQSGSSETYGANKMRNIHSGMLLDVKG